MKVTILGSGVLIPYPKRGNSGYFLESEKKKILIDGGSGTLRRIADNGLNYRDIDTICYSHLHPDHTIDLIPFLFALKHDPLVTRPKSVDIICPKLFKAIILTLYDELIEKLRFVSILNGFGYAGLNESWL